jgi:hypothetical protein
MSIASYQMPAPPMEIEPRILAHKHFPSIHISPAIILFQEQVRRH